MKRHSRVLVASDLGARSDEALLEAARLCRRLEGQLGVVHVVPLPEPARAISRPYRRSGLFATVETLTRVRKTVRRRIEELAPGNDVELFIDDGVAYDAIVRRAEAWNADVIVVGGRAPSAVEHLLRGVGERVVRHADCPVLVVALRADAAESSPRPTSRGRRSPPSSLARRRPSDARRG